MPDHEPEELQRAVDTVIAELLQRGALNDEMWARSRIQALRRRGNSMRQIRSKLRLKRVPPELIDTLLEAHRDAEPKAELKAALDYLRKRRLGPWAAQPDPQRTLAKLGRRGFSYGTAREALSMDLESARDVTDR